MRVINYIFLYFFLIYYLLKKKFFFMEKLVSPLFAVFFWIVYIFLFFLKLRVFYFLNLYIFKIKEKKKKIRINLLKKNNNNKKFQWKNKKKDSIFFLKFYKLYSRRRMYYGFSIVYMQIFLRRIRESKNYIIFFFEKKLKIFYNTLKKKIIYFTLVFSAFFNYNLVNFFFYKKKAVWNAIFFISFFELYNIKKLKVKFKEGLYFFLKKYKKW